MEFAGRLPDARRDEQGIDLNLIRPGEPVENAYAESFNGRVREECLNQPAFDLVSHARTVIETGREDHNTLRPHGPLGGLAPEDFLTRWAESHAPQPSGRTARVDRSALDGSIALSVNPTEV